MLCAFLFKVAFAFGKIWLSFTQFKKTLLNIICWYISRLANPFVLCLNLLGCSVAADGCSDGAGGSLTESQRPSTTTTTGVKFTFGILNRVSDDYEMFQPDNRPSKSGSTVLPANTRYFLWSSKKGLFDSLLTSFFVLEDTVSLFYTFTFLFSTAGILS